LKSADRLNQNNEDHNHTKGDDPQIPQPDLRFASENEANSKTTPKPKQKRGQSPTKTPTESICNRTQWHIHCITSKNMQKKMNYVSQLSRQT